MDFKAKREELLDLWQRMFNLCDGLVTRAERGESDLKASMVKELNQFLRLSAEILDKAEQEAQEAKMRAIMDDNVPLSALPSSDPDQDPADDLLPFPLVD